MGFLEDSCTFAVFNEDLSNSSKPFDCGHPDLNDFFTNDCINYSKELFGKTYCFTLDSDPSTIVCAFTISNDSIRTNLIPKKNKNRINRKVPQVKQKKSYPAVLIGRLGVNKDFKKSGVGSELMNFIKSWFIDTKNKTGCRFIVVDSYNEEIPLNYYTKNQFVYLFDDVNDEKKFAGIFKAQTKSWHPLTFPPLKWIPLKWPPLKWLPLNWLPKDLKMEEVKLITRLMYFDLIVLRR